MTAIGYGLLLACFAAATCASYHLAGLYRRYALAKGVLDEPNHRSSHTTSTPRGGGIAVVTVTSAVLILATIAGIFPLRACISILTSGLLVFLIGFVDDHRPVSSSLRLSLHFCAALAGLWLLSPLPQLIIFNYAIDVNSPLGIALYALSITWLINLYNFMDGIDGIASMEAISVLIGAALLLATIRVEQAALLLLLSAAVFGFLFWNWAPAKMFMGDGCSGFLGLLLGLLGVYLAQVTPLNLWCWMILLGVFVVDASWTLIVRMLTGQDWHKPHRSHSYQILARKFGSHTTISLTVVAINLLWLTPLAWACSNYPYLGIIWVLLAYMPLMLICLACKAGLRN